MNKEMKKETLSLPIAITQLIIIVIAIDSSY